MPETASISAAEAALAQWERTGYLRFVRACRPQGEGIAGRVDLECVRELQNDPRFASGAWYQFHEDVGDDLVDFRGYRGTFGKGALQIVVDRQTGAFYSDVDAFNPYADVVGFLGHAFGEVVPQTVAGWWRKVRGVSQPPTA